jgi:hypothetical protein
MILLSVLTWRLIPRLFVNGLLTFFNGIQGFKEELNKKLEEESKKTIHSISETQEFIQQLTV